MKLTTSRTNSTNSAMDQNKCKHKHNVNTYKRKYISVNVLKLQRRNYNKLV